MIDVCRSTRHTHTRGQTQQQHGPWIAKGTAAATSTTAGPVAAATAETTTPAAATAGPDQASSADELLPREPCLAGLAALRHAKWFQVRCCTSTLFLLLLLLHVTRILTTTHHHPEPGNGNPPAKGHCPSDQLLLRAFITRICCRSMRAVRGVAFALGWWRRRMSL